MLYETCILYSYGKNSMEAATHVYATEPMDGTGDTDAIITFSILYIVAIGLSVFMRIFNVEISH